MSNNADHLPTLSVLRKAERSRVTYYASFAHCLGNDVAAALFASNFLFWEGKQKDEDRWIYKDQKEITRETGLNRKAQEGARERLVEYGILEEKKAGLPRRLYYRWNWVVLEALLTEHFKDMDNDSPVEVQEPLLDAMRRIFDEAYEAQTAGVEFAWGSKTIRGKYYGNLKKLSDILAERVASRKTREAARLNGMAPAGFNAAATQEEVLVSWQAFLDRLPEYYRTKRLSPDLLLSDFSKIILEVQNNAQPQPTPRRNGTDNADAI